MTPPGSLYRRALRSPLNRLSLLQRWVFATLLAVVPLLLAISYAALTLQAQTSSQRALLDRMSAVNTHSAAVSEHAKEMVRLSRQYALLKEPGFLDLYRQKQSAMQASIRALRPILDGAESQRLMDALGSTGVRIENQLSAHPPVGNDELLGPAQLLVSLSAGLADAAQSYRRGGLRRGEEEFNTIVDQLYLVSLLALPGTLLLMLLGTYLVSRPLWRLSQAIRRLAGQDWTRPIAIRGPSDLVALGENLEWMRQQVNASQRQTTTFIQHITHELKTPIAAVIEAGRLLDEEIAGPLTQRQHAIVDVLGTNARNLEHLIQQLLNYNAVSHSLVAQQDEVDVRALCEGTRARLEAASPERNVRWDFHGEPARVRSDTRIVDMLLNNLLSNAFQSLPDGGSIRVRWASRDDGWQLSVSDDGPGIDPAQVEKMYQPLYNGRRGAARGSRTGLGLSIVLESVNLLRGSIEVDTAPGAGTTFNLVFPPMTAGR